MKRAERTISQIRRIYILTTLFLVALTVYVFTQIRNLAESSDLVTHADKVNLSLGKTLVYILNAETNQRGFLLTGDSALLRQKNADLDLMYTELRLLDTLSQGNERLLQKTAALHAVINDKLESMKEVLTASGAGLLPPPLAGDIIAGVGKMNLVRATVKGMVDSEKSLLDERTREYAKLEWLTPILIFILFLGSLLILFASYFRVNKAFARAKKLQEDIARSNTRLEKQNEELEERNNFTETLLNASPDHIFVVDRDTRYIAANKRSRDDYAALVQGNIIGKKVQEVVANAPLENIHRAFCGEQLTVTGFRSLISERIYEISYIPLYKKQEVYAVMVITHDISEQVKTQEAIRALNQSYEYGEQIGMFGSYRYNFAKGELFYSDNLFRLLGVEPGAFEAGGEKFLEFVHPDDKEYVKEATAAAFLKKEISRWEYRMVPAHGRLIYVRGTGKLVREEDDKLWMVGTLQDITEEKMLEISLKQKNDALERMNIELQSFAYISGHDLQEPLRKIRVFADQILESEKGNLTEEGADKFRRIQRAAGRMQMLITDLLHYSKTASAERTYEDSDLQALAEEVKDSMQEEIVAQQAKLEIDIMCRARVIRFQLKQLFYNLLSNSLKFRDKERALRVIMSSREISMVPPGSLTKQKELYCHITVEDNGIGFEQEYAEKIFNVFQRLNGKQEYEGTGIGLAIVKKIVENHEGFIRAEGVLGEGAKFDIFLKKE